MLQFEYEKLPIIEQVEIYSQTEPGFIFVCSKKDFRTPLYKWNNIYFRITKEIPKNIQDIKNSVYYGNIGSTKAKQLLKFLNSYNKVASPRTQEYTVFQIIQACWDSFDEALQLDSINQD